RFVSDARLICQVRGLGNIEGQLIPFSRLFAVNADGTDIRELGQRQSFDDARLRQFDAAILDWLPQDGTAVLMERDYVPEGRQTGTRTSRRADGLGVDRLDISTMRVTQIEPPTGQASGYITDGRGNIRMMIQARTGSEGQRISRTDYFYRLQGSRGWREFSSYDYVSREGSLPIAIDGERNLAYVLRKLNGRLALYRVTLDEGLASELVYANERVDVDYVVRLGRGGPLIGAAYTDDRERIHYFDRQYQELAASLSRSIPGNPAIGFRDLTADGNKILVFASSDSNPGRYYLYDRGRRALEEIMSVRPQLDAVRLASVRPITYPAADGVQVPAYLTLPPGRQDARGLPGIVLPHGGPSARDTGAFDELAQYLAHLGYAVLQPNYRGSEGYGDAWMAQNGFRGWQTSIGDVTAGGRWLLSQGVDAARLGIVGWSYGGYAALQSGVTEPGLFKAIVAIAPVTDLALLWEQAEGFSNYRLVREQVGQGPHVRAGSPLQNVERITAPVLMFHGTRDINVGVLHSQRMDGALRGAGKSSELVTFDGLEHDLGDSQALTRMFTRIGAFLQANLAAR
ncbi:MAG TPA: S9 family peptidase, partial [Allosphingosinicella sp.]|nr:S9 family peptidase [Allosphingosinicella sp.]